MLFRVQRIKILSLVGAVTGLSVPKLPDPRLGLASQLAWVDTLPASNYYSPIIIFRPRFCRRLAQKSGHRVREANTRVQSFCGFNSAIASWWQRRHPAAFSMVGRRGLHGQFGKRF
jgi:hypothetical protein